MKIQAPAKLNLSLKVVGKRPDGYHLLESKVVFLNLCDELELEIAAELSVNSDIADNIIIKAARALQPNLGAKIKLIKNIPMGAGLGGGSADAAATLVALNQLWELRYPAEKLYEIALKLGADVPVCLYHQLTGAKSAHFAGIGEVISPCELPDNYLYLLVNPSVHLATKDVFANLNGRDNLQEPAIELCPEIGAILRFLEGQESVFARMSGSGSTCFAAFENMEQAQKAAAKIPKNNGWQYWICTLAA